jgi:hypothetical protein
VPKREALLNTHKVKNPARPCARPRRIGIDRVRSETGCSACAARPDRSFAMGVIAAVALTGTICGVLSYLNQRQGHDILAAILAAGAIMFAVVCVALVILR